MQGTPLQELRGVIRVFGALLLVVGALVVFVGFMSLSNVYLGLASGAPPFPSVKSLLAGAFEAQAIGFLLAFVGIALLLIPRR